MFNECMCALWGRGRGLSRCTGFGIDVIAMSFTVVTERFFACPLSGGQGSLLQRPLLFVLFVLWNSMIVRVLLQKSKMLYES